MARTKYWCFTSYVGQDVLPSELTPELSYLTYQREICPETGREHWQGYLELTSRQRLQGAKRVLRDPAAHLEPRKGTATQASEYAQKEDTRKEGTSPVEVGHRSSVTQGQRTDLLAVKALLDKGATEAEIADEEFSTWAKYYRAIERYKRIQQPVRNFKTDLYVLAGETGVGKSRMCSEVYPDAYWKPRGNWWDGYDGQEVVIIDDFYGWLPWDLLLRLTDRYPLTVETKGGSVNFVAKTVVITSNQDYSQWYKEAIDKAPLERRMTRYEWIPAGQTVTMEMLTPRIGTSSESG